MLAKLGFLLMVNVDPYMAYIRILWHDDKRCGPLWGSDSFFEKVWQNIKNGTLEG